MTTSEKINLIVAIVIFTLITISSIVGSILFIERLNCQKNLRRLDVPSDVIYQECK